MRFTAAYYLLLLYSTVILRSIIPLASDALAHTFENAYHIATVHAKYGANHLETELAKNSADDNENKNQQNNKWQQEISFHISANEMENNLFINFCTTAYCCYLNPHFKNAFMQRHFPPPNIS